MFSVNRGEITVTYDSISIYEKNAKIICKDRKKNTISFISYRLNTNSNIAKLPTGTELYVKYMLEVKESGIEFVVHEIFALTEEKIINLSKVTEYNTKIEEML